MIEKMLKATVICQSKDRITTLKELRNLGILHVKQAENSSSKEVAAVRNGIERVNQSITLLSEVKTQLNYPAYDESNPKRLSETLLKVLDEMKILKADIDTCMRDKEMLEAWGDFSFEDIASLAQKGIYVYLCSAPDKLVSSYNEKGIIEIINAVKGTTYFALISKEKLASDTLPLAQLPVKKVSISELKSRIESLKKQIAEKDELIKSLSSSLDNIKHYKVKLEETLEFSINKESIEEDKNLSYLRCFVPAKHKDKLLSVAKDKGWGVFVEELTKEDNAPTLVTPPKIFKLAEPIFEFLSISPGYNEWDISGFMLIFFSLFFAMIIGDAGYALVFLIIAIAAKIIFRRDAKKRAPINLFIILSIITIIWGGLNGCYFSINTKYLPEGMHGLGYFTNPATSAIHMQYLCFLIAAVHLSLARFYKTILYINKLKALGQLGWGLVIWGNFFTAVKIIVYPADPFPVFAFFLYGIGLAFILLFYVNWREVTALFELPLSLIGSFIDVLSYIRLFAVGIASVYIAENFNLMGVQVVSISKWLFIFAIIIILLGHLLNVSLALMAVLVHGVRLNILEFSNHMELQWGGVPFKAFAKKVFKIKKN